MTPRIGELLVRRESVDPVQVSSALREQASVGMRLASLLVARAQLDADEATLALSEQHGVPAAMQRHLERRDPDAVELVPAEVARRWVVMPIGRARGGALVVCARDPTPILQAALEHLLRRQVLVAVALGAHVDRLVRATYGELTAPDDASSPAIAQLSELDVSLLDKTPVPRRVRSVSQILQMSGPELPRARSRQIAVDGIDAVLAETDRAITISAVERIVMAYAATRWESALLASIGDDAAVGLRGHGEQLGDAHLIAVPLDEPSLVSAARDTGELARGPVTDRLSSLLGAPIAAAAAPIRGPDRVEAVLVVGDPRDRDDVRGAFAELERLADALSGAYVRFARRR